MRTTFFAIAATLFAVSAHANPPNVVTDVAPIHSLVAQVMKGVAEPILLVPAKTSPHGHSLKVSQARALTEADIVFWVGEGLTPSIKKAINSLAENATAVELMDAKGITLLGYDESIEKEDHEHHHHGDGHGSHDPHIWLDPENARVIVMAVAEVLVTQDPDNAERYRANAIAADDALNQLIEETTARTDEIRDRRYIVYHDGYRYFEERFNLGRAIPIANSHAANPGAKRLAEIREALTQTRANCVFAEKQFGTRTVDSLIRGTDAVTAELDPMGQGFETGPALYAALIRDLSKTMVGCLR